MLVAFWSVASSGACISSNLTAIGACLAANTGAKIVAFENHICEGASLEKMCLPNKGLFQKVAEEPFYYSGKGMDKLYKVLRAGFDPESIGKTEVSVLKEGFSLLTGSFRKNPVIFDYEMNSVIDKLLVNLSERYDLVFADTAPGGSMSSKYILNEADVVIVNMLQDEKMFDEFFENYAEIAGKVYFIVGRYNENRQFNLSKMIEKYDICEEKIMCIRECNVLPLLISQGKLGDFVAKHSVSAKEGIAADYISDVRRAARKIGRLAFRKEREYCLNPA